MKMPKQRSRVRSHRRPSVRQRRRTFEQLEMRQLLAADSYSWQFPGHWHHGWEGAGDSAHTAGALPAVGNASSLDQQEDHFADEFGNPLFVEPPAPTASATELFDQSPSYLISTTDTFKLHSRPSANHTIYLDFDGHVTEGTTWNSSSGITSIVSPAYDPAGNGAAFTTTELTGIQNIWKRVAEDYSPFNVDVTTQDPGVAALSKSGGTDTRWGVRVVVTIDWDNCGCGGFAYLNSFNDSVDEPVFVFNSRESDVSAAASHEVGHSLGLSHDGTTAGAAYYNGHGTGETAWGPIMGSGYYTNMTTWDTGQYYLANNHENDWQIITSNNGFTYRTDDHGATTSTATALTQLGTSVSNPALMQVSSFGVIELDDDKDLFSFETDTGNIDLQINSYAQEVFVSNGSGFSRSVEAAPANQGSNLDVLARILDSNFQVVATSNPVSGLSAGFSNLLLPRGKYYLEIDGTGVGNWALNPPSGYDQSVSRGQYAISGTIVDIIADSGLSSFVIASVPGALVYQASQDGTVGAVGEVDSIPVTLEPGQRMSVALSPSPTLQGRVQVLDANNSEIGLQTSAVVGSGVLLQSLPTTAGGTYTIKVSGASSTTGRYFTKVFLNAVVEQEGSSGQALEPSVMRVGGDRYAVTGSADPTLGPLQLVRSNASAAFIDISSTGTALNLTDDGEATVTTTIGNSLFPAGSVTIGNNGGIVAGSGKDLDYANTNLPNAALGTALLPFWDDLDSDYGNVYWQQLTIGGIGALVVQWQNRPHYNSQASGATFQVQIFASGPSLARLAYKDVVFGSQPVDNGASATIGVQLSNSSALQYSYNAASIANDAVIDILQATNPDIDQFTIDLSAQVGKRIDVALSSIEGDTLRGQTLELIGPGGGVVATGSATPLGGRADNFDLAVLGYLVPAVGSNIYTIRFSSTVTARYTLALLASLTLDTEPNNDAAAGNIRSIDASLPALGYLGQTDADFYAISLTAGQRIVVETDLPLATTASSLNMLNPELAILGSDGLSILMSDLDSRDGKNARLEFTASNTGTYYLRAKATNGNGEYLLRLMAAAPRVASIVINGGELQRSEITSISVNFDALIDHARLAQAFLLTNIDTNTQVSGLAVGIPVDENGRTRVELTFVGGPSVELRSGVGLRANSLANGNYRLEILGSQVQTTAGLPMAEDFVFGGQTAAALNNDHFFRLLGDTNGDGVLNGIDLNAIIPALFNPLGYRQELDTNGDGVINGIDLNSLIPTLFGTSRR